MIRRWKDIDEAQFFHVERSLSLIIYGLRGILNLPKCGHSVFRDTQIDMGTSSD